MTKLCTTLCTTNSKTALLHGIARLWKRCCNSFCYVAGLILDKLPEPGCNVRLRDVDIVPSSDGGRAVAHKPSKAVAIHAGLCGPRPERVTPAVELERLQLGVLYGLFVRMLKRDDVPRIPSAGEHERGLLRLRFCPGWEALINTLGDETAAATRDMQEKLGVIVEPTVIDGVKAFILTPKVIAPENQNRLLVNINGGGYVYNPGIAGTEEPTSIAAYGGFKVISVDYRMPPDHPYPAGLVWRATAET